MSKPLNSLVVLPQFPDEGSGMGQRSLLFVEAAAHVGNAHIVVLDGGQPSYDICERYGAKSVNVLRSEHIAPSKKLQQKTIGLLRVLTPKWAYRPDPALRAQLEHLIQDTKAQAVLFRYAPSFCASGLTSQPGRAICVDIDDRDDQKYATRLIRVLGPRLSQSKFIHYKLKKVAQLLQKRLLRTDLVWFTAKEDVWPLETTRTSVINNVSFFEVEPQLDLNPSKPIVLFVGIAAHLPNQDGVRWFLDHCWQSIKTRHPNAEFRLVGRGDWAALAADYPDLDGVSYVGSVDILSAEYEAARLCICPVREGGGSKIKVIEAAAFAKAVVGSGHALRGFNDALKQNVVKADSPQAFIDACSTYLSDPKQAYQDGLDLQKVQTASYSKSAAIAAIEKDLSGLITEGSTP